MIPRNSLHKTTLQQITNKSTNSYSGFTFQGRQLFLQDISLEQSQDVLKSVQINIQKYRWKGTKSSNTDFSKVLKNQPKKVADLLSKELVSIEKLGLDLRSWINNESGPKLETLAYKIARNCKELKHLALDINLDSKTFQALQIFSKELVFRVQNLKTLSLQLKQSQNLLRDGIETFAKFLSRNYTLQDLSICFNGTVVHADELKGFAWWICTKLTKLRKLDLEFEETGVEDEGVEELTNRISTNLKELKHLRLFFGDTKVTEKGIQACMKNLQPINKNLVDLAVRFSQPKTMGKELIVNTARICPEVETLSRFGYLGFFRNPSKMYLAKR